jgi:hypothetical protein
MLTGNISSKLGTLRRTPVLNYEVLGIAILQMMNVGRETHFSSAE